MQHDGPPSPPPPRELVTRRRLIWLGGPPARRPRQLVTRRRLVWLGVLAALALLLAVANNFWRQERRPTYAVPVLPASPSPVEARWLDRLDAYVAWLSKERLDPYEVAIRRCDDEFDRRVGSAPTERLAAFEKIAAGACHELQQGASDSREGQTNFDAERTEKGIEEKEYGGRLLRQTTRVLHSAAPSRRSGTSSAMPARSRAR